MVFADSLTGGAIGGTIAASILALLCLAVVVGGLLGGWDWWGLTVGGVVCLVVVLGAYVWSMWPFSYDYHHWVEKNVVATTAPQSRLLTDSDGNISQKFVIRDTSGSYYGINDTRGSLIKEGDKLHLKCKKAYDFGIPREAHGWDCKWAGVQQ